MHHVDASGKERQGGSCLALLLGDTDVGLPASAVERRLPQIIGAVAKMDEMQHGPERREAGCGLLCCPEILTFGDHDIPSKVECHRSFELSPPWTRCSRPPNAARAGASLLRCPG